MKTLDPKMNLDVEQPEDVATVLEHVATIFRNNADELDAGWQDKTAGRPWRKIATILDRAALSCLKIS